MGEKAALAGMATAMGERNCLVGTAAINRAWRVCDVVIPRRELAGAIRGLIARDVIVGRDEYMFTVDLQRLWVQKYRRLEWVNEEIADAVREWSSTTTTAPRKVSRRMLLVGLAGLVALGGGITWLALSKKLFFVATPTPTPSPTLTPTPTPVLLYIYRGHFARCILWRGRLMAGVSHQGVPIQLCRCGMQLLETTPSPIAAMTLWCGTWNGRLMAHESLQRAAMPQYKYGNRAKS